MKKAALLSALFVSLALLACAGGTPPTTESGALPTLAPCTLSPIVVPTMPAEIPGYTELDETTGLHMTGTVQQIDVATWRLEITGTVQTPLSLTYDELRCMPKLERDALLICPGFFEDQAKWAGASLDYILRLAGAPEIFEGITLYGEDGYSAFVPYDALKNKDSFLAYEWEGEPVPILHGFPVRAVFPPLQGNKWVKWLYRIEVR